MTPATRGLTGAVVMALMILACRQEPVMPRRAGQGVLFIGNSLTFVNDLPATVAGIAATAGDTLRVEMVAEANFALVDHLQGHSNALAVLRGGGFKYVVLQQGPSTLPVNRDSLVLVTKLFEPAIRAVDARPALLMVWPSSDRIAYFDDVRVAYQRAAQGVNGLFIPAGEAWRLAWEMDPALQLYGPDGYHPSELGTYLAALVVFERLTSHDARLLPAVATVAGRRLTALPATVRLLQQAAHDANAKWENR